MLLHRPAEPYPEMLTTTSPGCAARSASPPSPSRSTAPGREVLDEDVGPREQAPDERAALRGLEVDRDDSLPRLSQTKWAPVP